MTDPVPAGWLARSAAVVWRLLVLAAALLAVLWLLSRVTLVVYALLVALLLTALLRPLAIWLRGRGMGRSLSSALVFGLGVVVLLGVLTFVVVQVGSHARRIAGQVGDVIQQTRLWLATGPLHIDSRQLDSLTDQLVNAINSHRTSIASGVATSAGHTLEVLGGGAIAAFATFFLLRDGERIWAWVLSMLPMGSRERWDISGGVAWRTLSSYVRGTVLVAFMDAVAVTVVLLITRVPLAVPVGVLIFLGAFVPVLGLTVTGAIAVGLTLVSRGPVIALIVLAAIVLAVQVEGHLFQPLIMSRAVRVHPLGVVVAVASGTLLAGIGGALIAVPLVAIISNLVRHWRSEPGGGGNGGAAEAGLAGPGAGTA